MTDKPPPTDVAPIDTAKLQPFSALPVFETTTPVDIVTRAPINKLKTPFQPVTPTGLLSDKLPASLSSISVPSKTLPETTDYTIPRVDIFGPEFIHAMCCGY